MKCERVCDRQHFPEKKLDAFFFNFFKLRILDQDKEKASLLGIRKVDDYHELELRGKLFGAGDGSLFLSSGVIRALYPSKIETHEECVMNRSPSVNKECC